MADENTKEINALIQVEGGLADSGVLDIHEAATAMYGLARAFNTVVHAFANDQSIRQKAKTAHGGYTVIHPATKGCFEEQISVRLDFKTSAKIGHSIVVNVFWDYLTWCWATATGQAYEPKTRYVQKLVEKDDVFIYEMADALERPLAHVHQPIVGNKAVTITLARPRIGDVLRLDQETLKFVSIRNEEAEVTHITGNVTKFNVLTDFGRLYSDEEGKVVSFKLDQPSVDMRTMAVTSMQEVVDGEAGKLLFTVSKVVSAQGFVKRYIVHEITAAPVEDDEWLQ